MSRTVPGIVSFLLVGVLAVHPVWSCSCTEPTTFEGAFAGSEAVFSGVVVGIHEIENSFLVRVEFDVVDCWKGDLSGQVALVTEADEASCGYPFTVGVSYLVYAIHRRLVEDQLYTHLCSRTHGLAHSPDLGQLGDRYCSVSVREVPWTNMKRLFGAR